ncbi:polyhydroxyalkanoate synthesis regulator phasin [Bacillus thermophilus]|uniref:Polyhydroxyalkanoate synthesis regulator phasin n=1 Tax=Siminovitchia thermophila TaxID=1245522 RepID=A0ABS2RBP4_9BACI|nr:hypothetical protein [Siminovitchia thermophila]MBM7716614.1 polyhydroxyalkanoate synthesis regulator phasin [Siminovitchia thermophila]ONK24350.1 hypothetical protein BLX87_05820 [Bacillus sp. VT-16-64]
MSKGKIAGEEAENLYDDILKTINHLSEKEAKSFLKLIYAKLDIVKYGNGKYSSKECVNELFEKFEDLNELRKKKK